MVSPQNLAIGAAAVGLGGQEGELFRKVIGWSLLLLLIMCVLVYLQSTAVLSWMVVLDRDEARARGIVGDGRVGLHGRAPAAHLRVRRAAAVPRDARRGRAARTRAEQVQAIVQACARDERAVGGARRRLRAERRRAAGQGRRADRALADEADPRDRPRQRARVRRAGRDQRQRVAPRSGPGFFYPPDPSSQIVCSIGGNVAENSGGAHCFKYGFTTNYVTGLEIVLGDGELVQVGGYELDPPGYDLLGAFVGSEGTLGVATKIWLRVVPSPETVKTLVAFFDSTHAAGEAVSRDRPGRRRPGRDRDDGRARDRGVRADGPRRLSGRPRRGLLVELDGSAARVRGALRRGRRDLRAQRLRRRARRPRRGRAPAVLEDAQGRVPGDGPDLAQLLRPGRRDPAHEAAGGARADRASWRASTA